jgi:hypothetical protein
MWDREPVTDNDPTTRPCGRGTGYVMPSLFPKDTICHISKCRYSSHQLLGKISALRSIQDRHNVLCRHVACLSVLSPIIELVSVT